MKDFRIWWFALGIYLYTTNTVRGDVWIYALGFYMHSRTSLMKYSIKRSHGNRARTSETHAKLRRANQTPHFIPQSYPAGNSWIKKKKNLRNKTYIKRAANIFCSAMCADFISGTPSHSRVCRVQQRSTFIHLSVRAKSA